MCRPIDPIRRRGFLRLSPPLVRRCSILHLSLLLFAAGLVASSSGKAEPQTKRQLTRTQYYTPDLEPVRAPEEIRRRVKSLSEIRQAVFRRQRKGLSGDLSRRLADVRGPRRRNRLLLLLGHLRIHDGLPAGAVEALGKIGGRFALEDFKLFEMGRAWARLAEHGKARALYLKVAAIPHSPLRFRAEVLAIEMSFADKKWQQAEDEYRRFLERYPEYPEAPRLRLRIADCRLALGKKLEAAALYQRIAFFHGEHSAGKLARTRLASLEKSGVKPAPLTFEERLRHAKHLRNFKRWHRALAMLGALLKLAGSDELRDEIRYEMALAYFGAELYDKALALFEALQSKGRSVRRFLFRTHRRLGRWKTVLAQLSGELSRAELLLADGRLKEAHRRLAQQNKRRRLRGDALWQFAWVNLRLGQYKDALKLFGKMRTRSERLSYFIARASYGAGHKKRALAIWTKLAKEKPLSYYGLISRNRLLEVGVRLDPRDQSTRRVVRWAKRKTSRFLWGKARTSPKPRRRLGLRTRLAALDRAARDYGKLFPQFERARDLRAIGFAAEARWEIQQVGLELRRLRRTSSRGGLQRLAALRHIPLLDNRRKKAGVWGSEIQPVKLSSRELHAEVTRLRAIQQLGDSFYERLTRAAEVVGEHYLPRKLSFRLSRFYQKLPEEDRAGYRRAYALGFRELVELYCARYKVPPYLFWALMTIESSYNPRAISVAGARGLMQVMPKTGSLIAERMKVADWNSDRLLDPETSIHFGAWYLRQLIDKFRGQETLAIPAYNAGPHNVAYWLKRKGAMPLDEFVEEIPFTQARNYLKKAIRFIAIYRRLYSNVTSVYISPRVDPRYLDNINW